MSTTDSVSSVHVNQPSLQKVTDNTKFPVTNTASDHLLKKAVKCPPVKLLSKKVDGVQPDSDISAVPANAVDSHLKTAPSSRHSPSRSKAGSEGSTTTSETRSKSARNLDKVKKDIEKSSSVIKEASSKIVKDNLAPDEAKKRPQQGTTTSNLSRRSGDSLAVKLKKPLELFGKARADVVRDKPDQPERPRADTFEAKRETYRADSTKGTSSNQASSLGKRHISGSSAQGGSYKIGKTSTASGELKADKQESTTAEVFPHPRLRLRSQKSVTSKNDVKSSQSNKPPSTANDKERRERSKRTSESSVKVTARSDQPLPFSDTLDQFIVVDTSNTSNEEVNPTGKGICNEKPDSPGEKEKSSKAREKDGSSQSTLNDGKPLESSVHESGSFASSDSERDVKKKRHKPERTEPAATESLPGHRDTENNSKPILRLGSHARRPRDGQSTDASTGNKEKYEQIKKEKRSKPEATCSEEKRKRLDTKRAEHSAEKCASQRLPRRDSPSSRSSRHRASGRVRERSGNRRPRERVEHYTRNFHPYIAEPAFDVSFDAFQEQNELRYPGTRESDLYMQPERSDRRYQMRSFWAEDDTSHLLPSSTSPEKYSRHGTKRRKIGRR
ncbi:hypothetical protein D918_06899 [Trichuris suis]|nr:hypothetical protein D918_06899 [Trichuris suis]